MAQTTEDTDPAVTPGEPAHCPCVDAETETLVVTSTNGRKAVCTTCYYPRDWSGDSPREPLVGDRS